MDQYAVSVKANSCILSATLVRVTLGMGEAQGWYFVERRDGYACLCHYGFRYDSLSTMSLPELERSAYGAFTTWFNPVESKLVVKRAREDFRLQ